MSNKRNICYRLDLLFNYEWQIKKKFEAWIRPCQYIYVVSNLHNTIYLWPIYLVILLITILKLFDGWKTVFAQKRTKNSSETLNVRFCKHFNISGENLKMRELPLVETMIICKYNTLQNLLHENILIHLKDNFFRYNIKPLSLCGVKF